ncbi:MAG TPA: Hsp20/alpha crystallin family protein [Bacteroidota bacterium]|nr:Hsp20/alpha crystallin family protein [Bacteroidota bacterium]
MSLVRWNPARDLSAFPSDVLSMRKEFNRLFDNFFHGDLADTTSAFTSAWVPAVDIAERENDFLVKMELPGVAKEDVKITMQEGILTVKGEKKQEKESKGSDYHRVERAYGSFQRSFSLPMAVRSGEIDASFSGGVLSITLPKAEEARPKQIDVKVK